MKKIGEIFAGILLSFFAFFNYIMKSRRINKSRKRNLALHHGIMRVKSFE